MCALLRVFFPQRVCAHCGLERVLTLKSSALYGAHTHTARIVVEIMQSGLVSRVYRKTIGDLSWPLAPVHKPCPQRGTFSPGRYYGQWGSRWGNTGGAKPICQPHRHLAREHKDQLQPALRRQPGTIPDGPVPALLRYTSKPAIAQLPD